MESDKQRESEKKRLKGSHWAYRGKVIHLRIDTYQFDHKTKIAEIVEHPGAVVIVPIDEKERVLLIQQSRKGADEILIELPAGTLEENEPPELCAKRELQEETGFAPKTMIDLGGFYSAPGFCNEYLHLFDEITYLLCTSGDVEVMLRLDSHFVRQLLIPIDIGVHNRVISQTEAFQIIRIKC